MSLKKIIKLPTQEYLQERFTYDEDLGALRWNYIEEGISEYYTDRGRKMFNTKYGGEVAGHEFKETRGSSYAIQVRLDKKSYYVHRLIYKLLKGIDVDIIDHEDGNRLNNKIENLRDVSNAENAKNCKMHVHNKSGHTGVSWSKSCNKWEAYIWKDSKKYNLGVYEDKEEAISVRKAKEVEFGYHPTHGKR